MNKEPLFYLARRNYEGSRNYVIVNPLQGKHLAVSPAQALGKMAELGNKIKTAYPDESFLCIGFAETATAIGAVCSDICSHYYIHTTREMLPGINNFFLFNEIHSHAAEQKLCSSRFEEIIKNIERIIFVEDEISTGKTIMAITDILKRKTDIKHFTAASLLNTMSAGASAVFADAGIDTICLHHFDNTGFDEKVLRIKSNDACFYKASAAGKNAIRTESMTIAGKIDPREGVVTKEYIDSCTFLAENIISKISDSTQSVLFLGTEECMYPAIKTAICFERMHPASKVRTHSTTRSPLAASGQNENPIKKAYQLSSAYDILRETFIYNIEYAYMAVIITDSESTAAYGLFMEQMEDILAKNGVKKALFVQWVKNA